MGLWRVVVALVLGAMGLVACAAEPVPPTPAPATSPSTPPSTPPAPLAPASCVGDTAPGGGSRVVLAVRTESGEPPPVELLNRAREVVESRVAQLGVPGAEVVVEGGGIVARFPGRDVGDCVDDLARPGKMYLRPVLETNPAPTDCDPTGAQDPTREVPACSEDGTGYRLGPAVLAGTDVESAAARPADGQIGFVVDLTFTPAGTATWGEYTAANVGQQVAFVLDGRVVSAPVINTAIFGPTQVAGDFSEAEAQRLADDLRFGALPATLAITEVQRVG